MENSSSRLAVPSINRHATPRSPSPSPAPRNPSRSPHPYRRSRQVRLQPSSNNCPSSPSPDFTRASTPLGGAVYGGSDSGTDLSGELRKRLLAPPDDRWQSAAEVSYDAEDDRDDDGRGRRRRRGPRAIKRNRFRIALLRRLIEVALFGLLVVAVLFGREGRAWKEVLIRRQELYCWFIPYAFVVLAYPARIVVRDGGLSLPRSLDPSPLLYPTILPILVALSLWTDTAHNNPYLTANLIISLSNIPPLFTMEPELHWFLSLIPLFPSPTDGYSQSQREALLFVPPMNFYLTSALTGLLYPSLTLSELRLLSTAMLNLLLHSSSPQAVILRTLLWGGGIGVFLMCEDLIKWNISLARVPTYKFRMAGRTIMSLGRLQSLGQIKPFRWKYTQVKNQASDSEAEVYTKGSRTRRRDRRSFTGLSITEARSRKALYAAAVYGIVLSLVLFGLRPYIGEHALDGNDPFVWAASYVFCGQKWFQRTVDHFTPGGGYCVTEGSTEAANLRLKVTYFWAFVLCAGFTLVTSVAPRIAVDTRRKTFHGMVILMFLVPGLLDPQFTHLALSVALALFILVDLVRAGQLPPASGYIARFLQPYVDGRDLKGPMVVSHVFLLLGSGIGWWLTLAAHNQRSWDWDGSVELPMVTGVVCVGLGDAAASLIGYRFGKTKWGWRGGKSIEGSLAFLVAVISGLSIGRLWIVGLRGDWGVSVWIKVFGAAAWGSMMEAVATGINDNVLVPLGVWALVRSLGL